MMRWLRRLGYGLVGLFGLIAMGIAALYAITSHDLLKTYTFPDASVPAAVDSIGLERGRHLVEVIGKCAVCHGDDYGGKLLLDNFAMGHLVSANLTGGRGGIGDYTDSDYERAIRHGVGRDGRALIFMPAEAYNALSDADLAAMIGFLRTLPAVDREPTRPRVGPVARALYVARGFPLLPVKLIDHVAVRRVPVPGPTVAYGQYLATVGACRSCHGQHLAGTGEPGAPDLTRNRLAAWTEADFFRALRQGRRPDGSAINPEKMPWVRSGKMTDEEIRALWAYLRSLPGRATT
ncbi:MAG TPA: c-type cytochrome [Gemmatimonadales bacterium]|jgi:cytochrome c553